MRKIFEEVSTKIFGKFFTFRPTAVFFLPVATNLIFVLIFINFHSYSISQCSFPFYVCLTHESENIKDLCVMVLAFPPNIILPNSIPGGIMSYGDL